MCLKPKPKSFLHQDAKSREETARVVEAIIAGHASDPSHAQLVGGLWGVQKDRQGPAESQRPGSQLLSKSMLEVIDNTRRKVVHDVGLQRWHGQVSSSYNPAYGGKEA